MIGNSTETSTEEWRTIPDTDGYEVSNLGSIRRTRIIAIRQQINSRGRKVVCLVGKRKKKVRAKVHTLVAHAFVGPRPPGLDVNHKDGDRLNNRFDNLEYVTRQENIEHARANRLYTGPKAINRKLSACDARSIKELLLTQSARSLAKQFRVSRGAIMAIKRNTSWKWVDSATLSKPDNGV